MERTPSPPRRVHTPPAPLHGSKHDSYEPFSPRRSSRVAAQHHLHHAQPSSSKSRTRAIRAVTPPSSSRSTRRIKYNSVVVDDSDSDLDAIVTGPITTFSAKRPPMDTMLPTPAKTPRKRSEKALGTTARVLFTDRLVSVDDALPTSKSGKSRKIDVFTDPKDRVATCFADDPFVDNPFVTHPPRGMARAITESRRQIPMRDPEMHLAAARGEGMVYMFRGKRVFRKYEDDPPKDTEDDAGNGAAEDNPAEDGTADDGAADDGTDDGAAAIANAAEDSAAQDGDAEDSTAEDGDTEDQQPVNADNLPTNVELLRQAGVPAGGRLTRSSGKPRLLFKEDIERVRIAREAEEADTDIEVPEMLTPPPTNRVKRQISFESWSRVKSSGKKRTGDSLESRSEKRTRSEHSPSPSDSYFTSDVADDDF